MVNTLIPMAYKPTKPVPNICGRSEKQKKKNINSTAAGNGVSFKKPRKESERFGDDREKRNTTPTTRAVCVRVRERTYAQNVPAEIPILTSAVSKPTRETAERQ